MTSSPRRRLALAGLALGAGLLLAAGAALLRERGGLERQHFALDNGWRGEPWFTDIREPRVTSVADLSGAAAAVMFSVRWRGWLWVEEPGRHRFELRANDAGYLALDGERLADTTGPPGTRRRKARKRLARGFHPIEIGLVQWDGEAGLEVGWARPGAVVAALPIDTLYARRPLDLARLVRRATPGFSPASRRLLGGLLFLPGLVAAAAAWRRLVSPAGPAEAPRRAVGTMLARLPAPLESALRSRRLRYRAFFAVVFVAAWAAAWRWSAATFAGDDVEYLSASRFGSEALWFFDRMVHVYLLRLFDLAAGGGPGFTGPRVYGATVFSVTVTALAVAVRHLGSRLQLRTLAVTLFLLFSQKAVVGSIGVAFADATAMMFVTVGLAAYLAGSTHRGPLESAGAHRLRPDGTALALGALALAAVKSKATGVIALYLPALWVLTGFRGGGRRGLRRAVWATAGGAAALLLLMTADALWLGDFWWSVRPSNLAGAGALQATLRQTPPRPALGWLDVLFPTGTPDKDIGLAVLWLLALAAPLVAGRRRRPLEGRLLLMLPAVFLLMLIVLYVHLTMPHYSSRMLMPILPAACFAGASVFFHLGIERPSWRRLLRPRVAVPLTLAAAAIWWGIAPWAAGEVPAGELVPASLGAPAGWQPDHLLRAALLPALALAALMAAALSFHRRRVRLAVVLVATLAVTAGVFQHNLRALERRTSAQVAELIIYPWRVFREEIEAARPRIIQVSPDVKYGLGMLGPSHTKVARWTLDRADLRIALHHATPGRADLAIGSRAAYNRWRVERPELAVGASFDPSGMLVLVRPHGSPGAGPGP